MLSRHAVANRTPRKLLLATLVAVSLGAGASCRGSRDKHQVPTPMESTSAATSPRPVPPQPTPSASSSARPGLLLEHQRGEHQPPIRDLQEWMRDHGVAVGQVHPPCWEIQAGVPLRSALVCHRAAKDRLTATIYVVQEGRLAKAWEGVVFADTNWLFTTFEFRGAGAELVVSDPPGNDCDRAVLRLEERTYPGLDDEELIRSVTEGCEQRGSYLWDGTRYAAAKRAAE